MSLEGKWFDAFRANGGPLIYSYNNRIPAIYDDLVNVLIYIIFSTLFLAFLIISPGIRKERFSTTICVCVNLFIGAAILMSNFGNSWHVGVAEIASPYRSFSREKLYATIGVNIGLTNVNVTLKANMIHKNHEDINYNERFYFNQPTEMKQEHRNALLKGLPYPITTVTEYLSQNAEGFCWGRRYRLAGHYAQFMLWVALSLWLLMNVLLCAVPRYGAYSMQLTGIAMLATNGIYWSLLPRRPLVIPFEGQWLTFQLGSSFWFLFAAGSVAFTVGGLIAVLDLLLPSRFSTIFEIDYDTPYRYFVGVDASNFASPYNDNCDYRKQCNNRILSSSKIEKDKNNNMKKDNIKLEQTALQQQLSSSSRNSSSTQDSSKDLIKKQSSDTTASSSVTSTTVDLSTSDPTLLADRSGSEERGHRQMNGIENGGYVSADPSEFESSIIDQTTISNTNFTQTKEENEAITVCSSSSCSGTSSYQMHTISPIQIDNGNKVSHNELIHTYIDGKRAVSLANFGRFAAAQQRSPHKKHICTPMTRYTLQPDRLNGRKQTNQTYIDFNGSAGLW